nr:hypothetical protein BaRGS_034645 [Batillaria attramentaria]
MAAQSTSDRAWVVQFGDKTEVYSWASLDYDWPNDTVKEDYVTSGKFVVQNNVITGVKEVGECSALQYVQSMEVDPNTGLMWIIDSGRVTSGSTGNPCPLKLIVYDIDQDREVRRFVFPSDVANPSTAFLNDIVLDYENGCVTHAYITDSREAKLYAYDVVRNEAYSFKDPTMQAEPPGRGTPIDGIAISADFDFVYYCPIEGKGLFQIPTAVLRDKTANFSQHVRRVGTRLDRSDGLTYGQNYLYFGLLAVSGVQRWDVTQDAENVGYDHATMTSQEAVVRDDVKMRWPDTFAWDDDGYLWFTANDLSGFFGGRMDFSGAGGPNMYVWRVFVNETSYLSRAATPANQRHCFTDGLIG